MAYGSKADAIMSGEAWQQAGTVAGGRIGEITSLTPSMKQRVNEKLGEGGL